LKYQIAPELACDIMESVAKQAGSDWMNRDHQEHRKIISEQKYMKGIFGALY
jgi:hypothetical protein